MSTTFEFKSNFYKNIKDGKIYRIVGQNVYDLISVSDLKGTPYIVSIAYFKYNMIPIEEKVIKILFGDSNEN